MSYEQIGARSLKAETQGEGGSDYYCELADWCELLAPDEQRKGFERILRELADFDLAPETGRKDIASQWISLLADSGAFESAAIALVPRDAIYTCGRMKDGSFIAQVIPQGGAGAHSRKARSLSMALLAALLRALARQDDNEQSACAH